MMIALHLAPDYTCEGGEGMAQFYLLSVFANVPAGLALAGVTIAPAHFLFPAAVMA